MTDREAIISLVSQFLPDKDVREVHVLVQGLVHAAKRRDKITDSQLCLAVADLCAMGEDSRQIIFDMITFVRSRDKDLRDAIGHIIDRDHVAPTRVWREFYHPVYTREEE